MQLNVHNKTCLTIPILQEYLEAQVQQFSDLTVPLILFLFVLLVCLSVDYHIRHYITVFLGAATLYSVWLLSIVLNIHGRREECRY